MLMMAWSQQQTRNNYENMDNLKKEFKMTAKETSYFLGLEIQRTQDCIKINQPAYAKRILQKYNFSECKAVSTPMEKSKDNCKRGNIVTDFPYRQAVGALMYLMIGTRPDLAYSVGYLSRHLENPTQEDIIKLKRVLRYISGTLSYGIKYEKQKENGLKCYSDADFGGCIETGRSTSGVVAVYAGGAISWLSQRQRIVSTSTTEAEIIAANEACKELIWLRRLYNEISNLKETPVLYIDNNAALRLTQNPEFHRRTKHISIKHFFIREKVSEGKIEVAKISTENQLADMMTKPLSKTRLEALCTKINLF